MSGWWQRSALEVDTLSWLTTSIVVAWVSSLILVHGTVSITLGGQAGPAPELQVLAIVVMASSALLIHGRATTNGPRIASTLSIGVFVLVAAAVAISAVGYAGSPVTAELWWAPLGAALVLMSISPVVPGRVYVPGAIGVIVVTAVASVVVAVAAASPTPIADAVIATSTVVFALIGGSVLTSTLVLGVEGWRADRRTTAELLEDSERVLSVIDEVTDQRLSSEVMVFLQGLADRGIVTDADRERAGMLAERLRGDLVQRDQQNWLTSLIAGRAVRVDDPERLAEIITVEQRGALIALLDGLFSDPQAGVRSARLALARRPEGTVAVALTIDLSLPEGRRTSVLTPYYLTVKSVVPRVEWRNGESLHVAFDAEPSEPATGPTTSAPADRPRR